MRPVLLLLCLPRLRRVSELTLCWQNEWRGYVDSLSCFWQRMGSLFCFCCQLRTIVLLLPCCCMYNDEGYIGKYNTFTWLSSPCCCYSSAGHTF